jgi:NADH-quinone oxidoreductase subunit G
LLGKLNNILHGKEELKEYSYQEIVQELSNSMATFRELVSLSDEQATRILNEKIARQTPRYSGRTAMTANINVSEPAPPRDPDSPLAFSMEGRREFPPSTLVPYYWSPGWNSVQAYYKYVEDPTGPLKGGDPGIRLRNDLPKNGLELQSVPQPFKVRPGSFYLFPVYHIYGSEEMSARGQAIKQRETETQLYLNPSDTLQTGIREGELAALSINGYKFRVKVKTDDSIPQGVAGIYRNLAIFPFWICPGGEK